MMKFSPEIDQLAAALAKAQGAFTKVIKDRTAKVPGRDGKAGYEYDYADLASVLQAVVPALSAEGLCIMQSLAPGDREFQTVITTRLMHSSGQHVVTETVIPVASATAQAIGGAFTYGRRYALCGLLGVAADEDDDGKNASTPEPEAAPRARPPAAQRQQPETRRDPPPRQERPPATRSTQQPGQKPAEQPPREATEADIRARGTTYILANSNATRAELDAMPYEGLCKRWRSLREEINAAVKGTRADNAA
jgi:hypothetical protein